LNPAIFLIDADGLIVHGNAAGRAALDKGDLLRGVNGRLTAIDPEVDKAMHAAFVAAGKNDAESGGKGSALPMKARAGERYVARVLPLPAGEKGRGGEPANAVAALFVRKAELEAEPSSEVIGKTYKL